MSREWDAAVDALRRPLQLAQRNATIPGLGVALRLSCERLLAMSGVEMLRAWAHEGERFEGMAVEQQRQHVARGLAVVAALVEPAGMAAGAADGGGRDAATMRRVGAGTGVGTGAGMASRSPSVAVPVRASGPAVPIAKPRPGATAVPIAKPSPAQSAKPSPAPIAIAKEKAEGKPKKARGAAAQAEPEGDPLAAATSSLKGIGPAFAARLAEKGLATVEDLLWLVPRRYDDLREVPSLAGALQRLAKTGPGGEEAAAPRITFVAAVQSARMVFARGRRWAEVRLVSPEALALAAGAPDPWPRLLVRWFNVWSGIEQRMPPGCRVVLSGTLRSGGGRPSSARVVEMASPDVLEILAADPSRPDASTEPAPRLIPHYPDVRGVPAARLRAACELACQRVAALVDDGVPASAERSCQLPPLGEAIAALHAPSLGIDEEALAQLNRGDSQWHRRLAFGELFALGVAVALRKAQRRGDQALPCAALDAAAAIAALSAVVPFSLTGAQRRVIAEISADLAAPSPMNRLLEGDVGAGKTLVALAAALQGVRSGCQVALMAPTAVLAEQHATGWQKLAAALQLRLALLTAATPRAEAAAILERLAAGALDILIGTHALLSEGVRFARLGLCIIDEQHRFGVAQRVKLRDKGHRGASPHLLVMTATPIPRTLALTAYGDLEVSILDELPPGRAPAHTRVMRAAKGEADALKLIAQRVAAGERAFVVCPKIGGDAADPDAPEDDTPWRDATSVAGELAKVLPRVGLVHGRLDAAARDEVMRAFRDGRLDVLVATTVIEVGVDVPAATVMAIFDADRFGLSQLHQLRGRVGRGGGKSHCLLLVRGEVTEEGARRLAVMTETTDGFRIAEEDLRLRGPGEILGAKQAGVPQLRYGDLRQHTELLLEARRAAEAVVASDPKLARPEHATLRLALRRRLGDREIFGAESG
jgi:ATP-dependent DNA helicase RecG